MAEQPKLKLSDVFNLLEADESQLQPKERETLKDNLTRISKMKRKGFQFASTHYWERDEVQRKANKQATVKQLDEWQGKVKRNREARHLDFALQDKDHTSGLLEGGIGDMSSKGRSVFSSKFVEEIEKREKQQQNGLEDKMEELEMGREDRQAVRKEILKQRRLMLQQEVKAKRLKKIKSKMYRRIRKRQKAREEDQEWQTRVKEDKTFYLDELEKMERQRAEQRASLKYNTRNRFTKMLRKYGGEKAAQEVAREIHQQKKELLQKAVEMQKEYGQESSDEEGIAEFETALREETGPAGKLGAGARQKAIALLEKQFLNLDGESIRFVEFMKFD